MRLVELGLRAFGPFTDVKLHFGAEPSMMHVIYGTNEAGKSTSLRAISGLLFGIPRTSTDGHTHRNPDLRIAGRLVSRSGATLEVVRRKGNVRTLESADGAPLEEALLAPFLGGMTESAFATLYGLDHERLRSGAAALLEGEGEVGESLFGAGVGQASIRSVLVALRADAEALYTPLGRKRKIISQALEDVKAARSRVSERSSTAKLYLEQKERLEQVEAAREQTQTARHRLGDERHHLERLRDVLPRVAKRAQFLTELSVLGEVPLLGEDAADRRERAERASLAARSAFERLGAELAELDQLAASLELNDPLSAVDPATIADLEEQLGRLRAAEKDLPKRRGEHRLVVDEAEAILRGLPFDLGLEEIERVRPSRPDAAALRRLVARHPGLVADVGHAERVLNERRRQLQACEAALGACTDTAELGSLRALLGRTRGAARLEEQSGRLERDIERQQVGCQTELLAMGLYRGTLEGLEALFIPPSETFERFDVEWQTREREAVGIDERARARARRRRELDARRLELEAEGQLPTEALLGTAREQRDAHVAELRRAAERGESSALERVELLAGAVRHADELVDRMRDEAERVAALAANEREVDATERERAALEAEAATVAERRAALEVRWNDHFRELGRVPLPPAEMRAWAERRRALIGKITALRASRAERQELEAQLARATAEVGVALSSSTDAVPAGLGGLIDRLDARVLELERAAQSRQQLVAQRDALAADVAELDATRHQAESALERWRGEWSVLLGGLGLPADSTPERAQALLDELTLLFEKVDQAGRLERRIAGMVRDSEALAARASELAGRHLPSAAALPVGDATEALVSRYRAAVRAREDFDRLEVQRADRRARLRQERQANEQAERELAVLMEEAHVNDLRAVREVEERVRVHARLRHRIEEVEHELIDRGEGASLSDLVESAAGVEPSAVRARLSDVEDELEALNERAAGLAEDASRLREGIKRYSDGAADAAEELQVRLAELSGHVERYTRLRLAADLLEAEVERYRERNQGPVLAHAEGLFPRLTLGRYSGLRVGYDAKDRQVLRCVRRDGREVDVGELSDGTRDQLYLSLRLATLMLHAEHGEPMPLVLDDILIHSDDERARAALEVLGELAGCFQILFFTHHARLVELAHEALPDSRLGTITLPRAS